ncbi:MAG: 50S ribosomal protein L18 [Thiohalomonadales bacterium]
MSKKVKRLRRARRTRAKISELGVHRLCVHKTPMHMYAQIIAPNGSDVVVSASTLEKTVRAELKHTGNIESATKIGQLVAERAKASGIESVAFDRSGFKYHGRIKAVADAAREVGLKL